MAQAPAPSRRAATHEQLAERALRRPSSTIWLHQVRVTTRHLDEALAFYVTTLGLTLRAVELDPAHPTRLRAILVDAEERDVLEIVEGGDEAPIANLSQLGFGLPRRAWHLLRTRLDTQEVPYRLSGDCLLLRDADGILVRVQPLGEC